MRLTIAIFCCLLWTQGVRAIDIPPLAEEAEVQKAVAAFVDWAQAWEAKNYNAQWALVHPRIQRWFPTRRWRQAMRRGRARSGDLTAFEITKAAAVDARKIPCTEQGHCYRKDMQVVLILIKSAYEKAAPGQPEYAVMANSDEGWRYGGGTFPAAPTGETMVILDRKDEARYDNHFDLQR